MVLYLRRAAHPQAHDNYRVTLKLDEGDFEIGSIGIQHGAAWRRGIDTLIPKRGRQGPHCMRQFRAAWDRFADDEANLKAKRLGHFA